MRPEVKPLMDLVMLRHVASFSGMFRHEESWIGFVVLGSLHVLIHISDKECGPYVPTYEGETISIESLTDLCRCKAQQAINSLLNAVGDK